MLRPTFIAAASIHRAAANFYPPLPGALLLAMMACDSSTEKNPVADQATARPVLIAPLQLIFINAECPRGTHAYRLSLVNPECSLRLTGAIDQRRWTNLNAKNHVA